MNTEIKKTIHDALLRQDPQTSGAWSKAEYIVDALIRDGHLQEDDFEEERFGVTIEGRNLYKVVDSRDGATLFTSASEKETRKIAERLNNPIRYQ